MRMRPHMQQLDKARIASPRQFQGGMAYALTYADAQAAHMSPERYHGHCNDKGGRPESGSVPGYG